MKTVILAGGFGTRLAEETEVRPKPMVEIGGHPILWHIMHHYLSYGFHEFVVALGYKSEFIKQYFLNYHSVARDLQIDLRTGKTEYFGEQVEDWSVSLIDTGLASNTGGRVLRLKPHLENETFMLTYGDGVSTVDIDALLAFHHQHGKIGTITAVRPAGRFGTVDIDNGTVLEFEEKSQARAGWINGGFMVFEPGIFRYLHDDSNVLEADALVQLARDGELCAYQHEGYWQCMDTLRDKRLLESLWNSGEAPWKIW
jgi:glucose-1-phosphate cytidylyltransferase